MGLSKGDQLQLILDILKTHQIDQVTRRNELAQISRLTTHLQNQSKSESEFTVLNSLQSYCNRESLDADGASVTSAQDLSTLIQDLKTT